MKYSDTVNAIIACLGVPYDAKGNHHGNHSPEFPVDEGLTN